MEPFLDRRQGIQGDLSARPDQDSPLQKLEAEPVAGLHVQGLADLAR